MIILLAKLLIPLILLLNIVPFLIWLERKASAFMQDRHGPNRASIMGIRLGGMLHSLADVVKLFTKEDFVPSVAHRSFYLLAPFIALTVALVTYAVIPFAHPITLPGGVFTFQAADLNVGVLYILAVSSMGVFGVMLAGWSANNKYALLGGLRSSAQMISYEVAMGLSLLTVFMMGASFDLSQIALAQTEIPWLWNGIKQPIACLIFIIAAFAETNRSPFDLPEGDSEIVAGYHVEYSSMKFAMFFMAEYLHMIVASALIATLFFGGWQVPFLSTELLREKADVGLFVVLIGHAILFVAAGLFLLSKFRKGRYGDKRDYEVVVLGLPLTLIGVGLGLFTLLHGEFSPGDPGRQIFAAVVQFGVFLAKILFFCWLFIWVRWTLPRFRYDQLMHLGWKVMIPLSLVNVTVTGAVLLI